MHSLRICGLLVGKIAVPTIARLPPIAAGSIGCLLLLAIATGCCSQLLLVVAAYCFRRLLLAVVVAEYVYWILIHSANHC